MNEIGSRGFMFYVKDGIFDQLVKNFKSKIQPYQTLHLSLLLTHKHDTKQTLLSSVSFTGKMGALIKMF